MHYLAYDVHMSSARMRARYPEAVALGSFWLHDWQLTFRHLPNIEPTTAGAVPCVLWTLPADRIFELDNDHPQHETLYLRLVLPDGPVTATTYAMPEPHARPLAPAPATVIAEMATGYREFGMQGSLPVLLRAQRASAATTTPPRVLRLVTG